MDHSITSAEIIIAQTSQWIINVVVGCNFCPFAAKAIKQETIHYEVLMNATAETVLPAVIAALHQLDNNAAIETSLLILPGSFLVFQEYLDMLDLAETLLQKEYYEGIYQLASFHPEYLFEGSTPEDPSNYTNRSPYPMLHFLREDSVSNAVDNYPGIDKIPGRNIAFTKEKGIEYMKKLSGL